jgi:hypothetical protein
MTIKALYDWAEAHGCTDHELFYETNSGVERFVDCSLDFSKEGEKKVILFDEDILW